MRPQLAALLRAHLDFRHLKIEDGPGRPLGRSFRVKLWPTFVFMEDGRVIQQVVRPGPDELREAFGVAAGGRSDPPGTGGEAGR